MFQEAFPDEQDPFVYNNLKKAIGAFERQLLTPSRFDQYLVGDKNALTIGEQKGLKTFIDQGCITCHMGNLLGGSMYQKMGIYANYSETIGTKKDDLGRYTVTKSDADKYMFKVPSLRNIDQTAPYFHDGAVESLEESVRLMGKIQLNKELTEEQVKDIVIYLRSLTGEVPIEYQKAPELPI
jgi:cytochrome c peroxidase